MSRLVITMRDPLAMRLATAAKLTGLHPEDIALCAVVSRGSHRTRGTAGAAAGTGTDHRAACRLGNAELAP